VTQRPGVHCGIGWRHLHYQSLLARRPNLPFLEVHAENFFATGGALPALLQAARAHYPISLHGVGLGLGSAAGLDAAHLAHLAALVERTEPVRVSDHACFARSADPSRHGLDLLPIAFDDQSLHTLQSHVHQVQERLGRPILVENLSAYLAWDSDHIAEPEFFNALTRSTGCGVLLDLNNLVVNAKNRGDADPLAACQAWVDALRPGSVGQLHLAGHTTVDGLSIDDHGSSVSDTVWALHRHTVSRFGAVPALIEWDTDVPELDVLLAQAAQADAQARAVGAA
jgi:uncharacterized protein (UPF0276 family)